MYGQYGLCLTACGDLGEGCAVRTFFMGISNCREIPCAASSRRSTVNSLMARRTAVGAASPNRRESIHGETGKGDPFWGWEPGYVHLAKSRWFRSNIVVVWNRFMVLSIHGSFWVWAPRNSARYWTSTPTLAPLRFRKPKRLSPFGKNYLSIQSQKRMWAT